MFSNNEDNNNQEAEPVKLGESAEEEKESSESKIRTIPDSFYGGKNPQVYEEKEQARQRVKEKIEQQKQQQEQQQKQQQQEIEQPEDVSDSENSGSVWLKVAGAVGGLLLLFLIVAGGYLYTIGYFGTSTQEEVAQKEQEQQTDKQETQQESESTQEETEPTQPQPTTSTQPTPTTTQQSETTTEQEAPTTTMPEVSETLRFPEILLSDGTDLDSDDLTDDEEQIFDTDSGTWDTDGDGYFDGQEIRNLYHPDGTAPTELSDSDLVSNYENPVFGYEVYYPSQWEVDSVDEDQREILFNAITGDYILIRSVEKQEGEDFDQWFNRKIEGQSRTDLEQFENKFGIEGYRRSDHLVAYFPGSDNVYVLIYNPGIRDQIPFREIMKMMYQSFRIPGESQPLGRQNVIPETQTTTTQDNSDQESEDSNTTTQSSGQQGVTTTSETVTSS